VDEEPFVVEVDSGELHGHRGGTGAPALLLHGGPAVPDYMGPCALELDGLFSTIRYTQRGTPPSTTGPPYSIESHVSDALAVIDALAVDRAWAVGHSWGGHLSLHLHVNHPDRLLGVVCIDPLGAYGEIFGEFGANLRRAMGEVAAARVGEIEALRRERRATEQDLLERFDLIWPHFFAEPERAPQSPADRIGVGSSTDTNASISEHFDRGTLAKGLPSASLPVLFVHGERDPLPLRTSTETAALIPGARVELVPGCGHFPWLERPGEVRGRVEAFLSLAG
jgi:pimeloyl-ACP methyl ester carboxylesterase